MIALDRLTDIGTFAKPHGIKGEITAAIDADTAEALKEIGHIFVPVDGLVVPFTVEGIRPKSSETVLLTLKGISDEKKASALANKDIYVETELLPEELANDEDGFYLDDLIGFTVICGGKALGTIADYDDSTANILFKVATAEGGELLIPADDSLIDAVDPEKSTIEMTLPEGLLDL